jgi:adenosine deaminase
LAREVFHLSDDELADIARSGIRASFADDETKSTLLMAVDSWLAHELE